MAETDDQTFLVEFLKVCRSARFDVEDLSDLSYSFSRGRRSKVEFAVAFQEIRDALCSESEEVRSRGELIIRLLGPGNLPLLTELIDGPDRELQRFAIYQLIQIGLPQAGDALIKAMKHAIHHDYCNITYEFAYGDHDMLGMLSSESIICLIEQCCKFLRKEYSDPSVDKSELNQSIWNCEYYSCYILMQLGPAARAAIPTLIGVIMADRGHHNRVRKRATDALGAIGLPDAALALLNSWGKNTHGSPWQDIKNTNASPLQDIPINSLCRIEEAGDVTAVAVKSEVSVNKWDDEARDFDKQLQVFYLVGCAYKSGHSSMRAADRYLKKIMIAHHSETHPLAVTNVSFKKNIVDLIPLFCKILGKDNVTLLIEEKIGQQHLPIQFSNDGWNAWEWTDGLLKRRRGADWWGFSLAHENRPAVGQ